MKCPQNLHFIGIGGAGMSAVAYVCHHEGMRVSGTDAHASPAVRRLQGLGLPVEIGHHAAHVPLEAQAIVVSTAVPRDNPEIVEAERRGLPVMHRSEVLGALMAQKDSFAVTGTHGKTTTSGMLSSILIEAGKDPSVLLGGDLPSMGGNARAGKGPHLVAEADESDKSLVNLCARIVIVTNLEGDHLEHYRDLDEIIDVVAKFINALPQGSSVVACIDDAGVKKLLANVRVPVVTYGLSDSADYSIDAIELKATGSTFQVRGCEINLQVSGQHNVLNATAALAAADLAGVAPQESRLGLFSFTGVKRRFQTVGQVAGVTVVDDYAHHPSEVKATLAAARLLGRPIRAVFQPHRHSRLQALIGEFATSFSGVSSLTVLSTYSAGEAPRGVDAGALVDLVRSIDPTFPVNYCPQMSQAIEYLLGSVAPGDLVLLLGAGDVYLVAQPLLGALESRFNPAAQSA